ncbi:MAG: hypothetical protein M1827_005217 [Pycnora praestabilis]|nr:MAG: hypothetical protein M1827_005217 [Pycnora praestabilis]
MEDYIPPAKPLRDELVRLYFKDVHPFCPVVDEFDFYQTYEQYDVEGESVFFSRFKLIVFQAMLFCSSTMQAQLFRTVKELYEGGYETDEISLTQAAVLLSHWCPFDSESQANSYWVNRAFYHAKEAGLHEPENRSGLAATSRYQIIWWCCLVRERLTAFSLRRPEELRVDYSTNSAVRREDFGFESCFPSFTDLRSKAWTIEVFLWLCKLSEIMGQIMDFQRRHHYVPCTVSVGEGRAVKPRELLGVAELDRQLMTWRRDFLKAFKDAVADSSAVKKHFYILRIISEYVIIRSSLSTSPNFFADNKVIWCLKSSVLASLYIPYMYLAPNAQPIVEAFSKAALRNVKAASSRVAESTRELLAHSRVEELPSSLTVWIPLSIAIHFTDLNMETPSRRSASLHRLKNLMRLLYVLRLRFLGGKYVAELVESALKAVSWNSETLLDDGVGGASGVMSGRGRDEEGSGLDGGMGGSGGEKGAEHEARLLTRLAGHIDLGLATESLGRTASASDSPPSSSSSSSPSGGLFSEAMDVS